MSNSCIDPDKKIQEVDVVYCLYLGDGTIGLKHFFLNCTF